jgi:hypothetical protein
MKMLHNVVVKDHQTDSVEIIARSYDETAASNYVKKNWTSHLPASLFTASIRADAVKNPFDSVVRLDVERLSTGVDTHGLQRYARQGVRS